MDTEVNGLGVIIPADLIVVRQPGHINIHDIITAQHENGDYDIVVFIPYCIESSREN
jgi:hypothetical protein